MNIEIPVEVMWAIAGYILVTTGGFIWWAATTSEQIKTLKDLVKSLILADGLYARKEDMVRELGVIIQRQETMWNKYDALKEKVDSNGH
jgi:hypothetical protein